MIRPDFSLVLPAFNSAAYIDTNVRRVLDFYERSDIRGEVIVADDGSADGTARAVHDAANVHVLRLAHRGKGRALRSGIAAAGGEIRAFTDADLPYGLDGLPSAMRWIRERGYHAVIGDRTLPGSDYLRQRPTRAVLSGVASFMFRTLVTGGIYDTQCGLKVFRGDVAAEIFRLCRVDAFAIDVEVIYLLLKYRLDLKRMPVRLEARTPSSVRPIRDSVTAARDVLSIRANWALGRYRSGTLDNILREDLRLDWDVAGRRDEASDAD